MGEEVHKPGFEALSSDILPLLASCKWHERQAMRILRDRRIAGKPVWLLGVRHTACRAPLGRVAIIATWNYPVQLLGVQLVQAVVAGNRVTVKPSEHAPRTQRLLLDLAREAGLDADDLIVMPATREAGAALVESGGFDHLVFTGSTTVGVRIAESLASRLIPSTLELSGNDTAVVLASADVPLAARSIWYALTLNHGQTCMAPRRVLVDPSVQDRFLDQIRALASSAQPRQLINNQATESCRAVAREAIAAGGRLITGDPEAELLSPIVIARGDNASAWDATALSRGDHFGPLLEVQSLTGASDSSEADFNESEAPARQRHNPLTCSVFGSPAEAVAFAARSQAGTVFINDAIIPTGHPGAGLTARGRSGWGVSRGEPGLLAMTRPVSLSRTSRRVRLPLDPPRGVPIAKMTRWVRRLYAGSAGSNAPAAKNPEHPGLPGASRGLNITNASEQGS